MLVGAKRRVRSTPSRTRPLVVPALGADEEEACKHERDEDAQEEKALVNGGTPGTHEAAKLLHGENIEEEERDDGELGGPIVAKTEEVSDAHERGEYDGKQGGYV